MYLKKLEASRSGSSLPEDPKIREIYETLVAFYRPKAPGDSFDEYTFRGVGTTTYEYVFSLGPPDSVAVAWYLMSQTLTGMRLPLPDERESAAFLFSKQRDEALMDIPMTFGRPRPELPEPYKVVEGQGRLPHRVMNDRPMEIPVRGNWANMPVPTAEQQAAFMRLYYAPLGMFSSDLQAKVSQRIPYMPPEMILESVAMEDLLKKAFGPETLEENPMLLRVRFPLIFDDSGTCMCPVYGGPPVIVNSNESLYPMLQRLISGMPGTRLGTYQIFPKLVSLERDCGTIVLRYGPSKFKVPCEIVNGLLPMLSAAFAQRGMNLQGISSFTF